MECPVCGSQIFDDKSTNADYIKKAELLTLINLMCQVHKAVDKNLKRNAFFSRKWAELDTQVEALKHTFIQDFGKGHERWREFEQRYTIVRGKLDEMKESD